MLYNGINFYEDACKAKTEAEFIAHESHHGLTEKQLKEVWALISPVVWEPENPHGLPEMSKSEKKAHFKKVSE